MNIEESLDAFGVRAGDAEAFLKSMASRHRLMILCALHGGERSVSELRDALGISQSGLSQHLAKLRDEKIVSTRRQAQTIYYSLASETAGKLVALLHEAFCARQ